MQSAFLRPSAARHSSKRFVRRRNDLPRRPGVPAATVSSFHLFLSCPRAVGPDCPSSRTYTFKIESSTATVHPLTGTEQVTCEARESLPTAGLRFASSLYIQVPASCLQGGWPLIREEHPMLFEAIKEGSQQFHIKEGDVPYYDDFTAAHRRGDFVHSDGITEDKVRELIDFLNQWKTRYPRRPRELMELLKQVAFLLRRLDHLDLLHADLNPSSEVTSKIEYVFDTLVTCGGKNQKTGTSKILHMINPYLFVMWDGPISAGYAVSDRSAEDYAIRFLPRQQTIARLAIEQVKETRGVNEKTAISWLRCFQGHTLAKVVDEFNYTKFTLKLDKVWDAELSGRKVAPSQSCRGLG